MAAWAFSILFCWVIFNPLQHIRAENSAGPVSRLAVKYYYCAVIIKFDILNHPVNKLIFAVIRLVKKRNQRFIIRMTCGIKY